MVAFKDPMDSQQQAMENLGPKGTSTWGYIFGSTFVVLTWLAMWRGMGLLAALLTGRRSGSALSPGLFDHLESIVTMAIFVALFFGALMLLNTMNGKKAAGGNVLFSAGFALLPLSIFALFFLLLSFIAGEASSDGAEILNYITVFVLCFALGGFFLLTFATLSNILGYTRQKAFWLTPVVIGATFIVFTWCTKITGKIGDIG